MRNRSWTDKETQYLREHYPTHGAEAVATALKRSKNSVFNKAVDLGIRYMGSAFDVENIPAPEDAIPSLLKRRMEEFSARKAEARPRREGIKIRVNHRGPIGIGIVGDPHLDDPGTDIALFRADCEILASRPNILAGNIGDVVNNWIGKLARLHGEQQTTAEESIQLIEWMCEAIPWGWVILGNHDLWSPIIARVLRERAPMAAIVPHGGRFVFEGAGYSVRLDARHDHPGRSQYTAAFAQQKAAWRGSPCHIHVGGHIHEGAYSQIHNPYTQITSHNIRLGSYKAIDSYADAKGYIGNGIAPSCLCVVNPLRTEDEAGFITTFFDLQNGVDYLDALQAKYDAEVGERLTG